MSDTAAWCAAAILVSAGVLADAYLALMFIRDWRSGRAEQRARQARWRSGANSSGPSRHLPRVHACAALTAVGMTAAVAAAQATGPQPSGAASPVSSRTQVVEGGQAKEAGLPAPGEAIPVVDAPPSVGPAISVQLNLDFANVYFYRGIRQQDKGLIVQPAARLTTRLVDDADFKVDGFIGTWNSLGPNGGTQTGALVEDCYESDLYAGFTFSRGKLSLTASYTFLTSPSDAFQTVQELGFTLALDDSEWMRAWSLKPYAMVSVETGSNGSDGPDLDKGVYLELGIAPGFSFDVGKTPVTLTFPASVGLSLSDYYQDAGGNDDALGFAQVGAKASIPLGEPGRLGAWTLNAGVSMLFLGDHTKAFNNGDDTEVIGAIGLQWNF